MEKPEKGTFDVSVGPTPFSGQAPQEQSQGGSLPVDALPARRTGTQQRAAEFLAGAVATVFSFVTSVSWTLAKGLTIGKTASIAVRWLGNISWVTTAICCVSLGWSTYASANLKLAASGFDSVALNVGFALSTVLAACVLKSVSLIGVYQQGEANPTLNSASVTTWFSFIWIFIWKSLRTWNDASLLDEVQETKGSKQEVPKVHPYASAAGSFSTPQPFLGYRRKIRL